MVRVSRRFSEKTLAAPGAIGSPEEHPISATATTPPDERQPLAWMRTRLALERTLLAWIRTAVSLIGFGFAIVKFFAVFEKDGVTVTSPGTARLLGISLVAVGTLSLVLATIQYLFAARDLEGERFRALATYGSVPRFRPALIVTLTLTAVGAITLWALLVMPR